MCRVAALAEAAHTLTLPYTYTLVKGSAAKQAARKQLGTMSAEIIKIMRDEVAHAAVVQYLLSKDITMNEIGHIFSKVPQEAEKDGSS